MPRGRAIKAGLRFANPSAFLDKATALTQPQGNAAHAKPGNEADSTDL
jgi:hypothetical protein